MYDWRIIRKETDVKLMLADYQLKLKKLDGQESVPGSFKFKTYRKRLEQKIRWLKTLLEKK